MDVEIITRIALSLILVCTLAALFIVYVLPKYYKQQKASDQLFRLKSKIKLDHDHAILIVEAENSESLVFISTKQQASLIGTINSENKFSHI